MATIVIHYELGGSNTTATYTQHTIPEAIEDFEWPRGKGAHTRITKITRNGKTVSPKEWK